MIATMLIYISWIQKETELLKVVRQPVERAQYGYWTYLVAGLDSKLPFAVCFSNHTTAAEVTKCSQNVRWHIYSQGKK